MKGRGLVPHALHPFPSPARSVLAVLGAAAIIIGILGMHVWMNDHTMPSAMAMSMTTSAGAPAGQTPDMSGGHAEVRLVSVPATGEHCAESGPGGCSGSCGNSTLAVTCVLSLSLDPAAPLIGPSASFTVPRGGSSGPWPPDASSAGPRAPFLLQLCISRT